jgi:hypothetical protein
MTFFSQACRTCGTTHFIRLCTILHATGFGLPPNFEDCYVQTQTSVIFSNISMIIMYYEYMTTQHFVRFLFIH